MIRSTVNSQNQEAFSCYELEGSIDHNTVNILMMKIEEHIENCIKQRVNIHFDFSAVTQVTTSALAMMLAIQRKGNQCKVNITFGRLPNTLLSILKVSNIDHLFKTA